MSKKKIVVDNEEKNSQIAMCMTSLSSCVDEVDAILDEYNGISEEMQELASCFMNHSRTTIGSFDYGDTEFVGGGEDLLAEMAELSDQFNEEIEYGVEELNDLKELAKDDWMKILSKEVDTKCYAWKCIERAAEATKKKKKKK